MKCVACVKGVMFLITKSEGSIKLMENELIGPNSKTDKDGSSDGRFVWSKHIKLDWFRAFRLVMLFLLLLCSLIGMFFMQQNMNGFVNTISQTPSQQMVYGTLGF
jgi:hypothetical protein